MGDFHGSRPRQRKYQPSLQEPKAKTEEAERGRKKLALWIGRESENLPPIGLISTIHKRFQIKGRRIEIEIGKGEEAVWFFGICESEKEEEFWRRSRMC
ncbi:unnamed protein product [Microthlaspi erraticum]|uniref:Uncharacterized protein n=1 Tax=Microthlaspi erraticum TaxID=1685480 RepID=A0A6D2I6W0_9BRAS|nr:unnamed protein product [Microthlaspi erraticum]